MKVLQDFRRIADALERLAATLTRAVALLDANRPSDDRLAQLELDRAQFESDCEGLLMKAEGKLKAAANAESRERTMQRRSADEFDPFDHAGEEVEATLPEGDAPNGVTEELQQLRLGLEADTPKSRALRAKFAI